MPLSKRQEEADLKFKILVLAALRHILVGELYGNGDGSSTRRIIERLNVGLGELHKQEGE